MLPLGIGSNGTTNSAQDDYSLLCVLYVQSRSKPLLNSGPQSGGAKSSSQCHGCTGII